MKIKVAATTVDKGYTIQIKRGLLSEAGKIIKRITHDRIAVLTNKTVHELWYRDLHKSFKQVGLKENIIVIPDGERYKNNRTYNRIISEMLDYGINRHSTLVTFGGGVTGDIGGFIAATYMRGIKLIHIPTSLIAQIDSSIGGKAAIDHPRAKNIIGAFYNPEYVLIDPNLLMTLPRREYINGLFEAVKIAIVRDKKLYKYICVNIDKILDRNARTVEYLVTECARLKTEIIQKDPFEKKLRMILNFGHTFGHALETAGRYNNISHGIAVGWGMLLALQLSYHYKYIDLEKCREIIDLIGKLIGRNKMPKISPENIWITMCHDKKVKNNKVRFILLERIARPIIREIDKNSFKKALRDL